MGSRREQAWDTTNETIEKLINGLDVGKGTELFGKDGLVKQITKRLVERALQAEMADHLGYAKGERGPGPKPNPRNGTTTKRLKIDGGEIEIEVARDRQSTFEPQLVKKSQVRLTGFDDKVLPLYARGMSTRQIQGHLHELYGTQVSPELISKVTDAILETSSNGASGLWPPFGRSSTSTRWSFVFATVGPCDASPPIWRSAPEEVSSRGGRVRPRADRVRSRADRRVPVLLLHPQKR